MASSSFNPKTHTVLTLLILQTQIRYTYIHTHITQYQIITTEYPTHSASEQSYSDALQFQYLYHTSCNSYQITFHEVPIKYIPLFKHHRKIKSRYLFFTTSSKVLMISLSIPLQCLSLIIDWRTLTLSDQSDLTTC